ncbi:hypothetical protein K435DRAFT_813405 [Dendrothele bispora CBS 962.96]|uniref:Uncharacterized protein n=1 Tax=Dendrothele bispora (strain CBS 962.96) TaxID=1314807 RepID=A0A4S8KLV3_DENBC|nr:hypothetical protein K435DRAFT_813405 [Dendrothele bispora CBS 962.96]
MGKPGLGRSKRAALCSSRGARGLILSLSLLLVAANLLLYPILKLPVRARSPGSPYGSLDQLEGGLLTAPHGGGSPGYLGSLQSSVVRRRPVLSMRVSGVGVVAGVLSSALSKLVIADPLANLLSPLSLSAPLVLYRNRGVEQSTTTLGFSPLLTPSWIKLAKKFTGLVSINVE